jgi:hypothetical protein
MSGKQVGVDMGRAPRDFQQLIPSNLLPNFRFIVRDFVFEEDSVEKYNAEVEAAQTNEKELWVRTPCKVIFPMKTTHLPVLRLD